MAIINWIGKEKIVDHDKDVSFRLMKKNQKFSYPNPKTGGPSENLIIEGDNLEALKALMPHYAGQVKCIYIDPPYNTGNEKWVYNDRVNSPKISQWLGEVVGSEGEDLTRHDKWLCMMYPRLNLLRELLSDSGVLFVSIDDNEHCNLRVMLDEIFGETNFVGTLIWQRAKGGGNAKEVVRGHEYVVVYRKNKNTLINLTQRGEKALTHQKNFKRHPEKYLEINGVLYFLNDDVIRRVFGKYTKGEERRCEYEDLLKYKSKKIKDEVDAKIAAGEYVLKKNKIGKHYICRLEPVEDMKQKMYTIIQGFLSEVGKNDLAQLGMEQKFDYPKPVGLIKTLIDSTCTKDSLILDSFAGSGTTGHAVFELNKEDRGNRKFILVQMIEKKKNVAKEVTAERIKRAIKKYGYADGFEYVELSDPLFGTDGNINPNVGFSDLASYIYFTETHTNIDPKKISGSLIGKYNETTYFLLFKKIGANTLTKNALASIKSPGKKIIYADKCLVDQDTLEHHHVVFKQIPYSVRVY